MFGSILLPLAIIFVPATIVFGMSKNHYYDSDDYTGNGCAH
jgi:hypothetical protein